MVAWSWTASIVVKNSPAPVTRAGFLGQRQTHVPFTPADGGGRTRLWSHRKLQPLSLACRPLPGGELVRFGEVHWVATLFASDDQFEPIDWAVKLIELSH